MQLKLKWQLVNTNNYECIIIAIILNLNYEIDVG